MALRRRESNEDQRPADPGSDSGFEGDYPDLALFLWADQWPDTKAPRRTGTVTFFVEQGRWKACLNDRDQSLVAFATDNTFLGLLDVLDTGLEQDALDWRKAASGGNSRKRS